MEKHILSKSTFIKGHQCLKALYLHKKRPFLRDKLSAEQLAKFKRGHKVGDMAQHLFPGGVDVSPKSPSQYQKSALRTQELIASGQEVIYEATFQFNKVLVMLDILVKTKNGWDAYEVKSSLALSETYYTDAALQYYVITNSGLELNSFSLVYVNKDYQKKEGEIDLSSYFIKKEVSKEIIGKQNDIAKKIDEEIEMLSGAHSPKIDVGAQCFSPYSCDFIGFCWKNKPKDLFKIPSLTHSERKELLNQGILDKKELGSLKWENPVIKKQLDCLISNVPFVSENSSAFFSSISGQPIFLSFISRRAAIPQCINSKPYEQQLIAYAISSKEAINKDLFTGSCEEYPAFVEAWVKSLREASSIVVFDKEELHSLLHQITVSFPQMIKDIDSLSDKIFGIKQAIISGDFFFLGLKHDLVFKDVVREILGVFPFSKQPIYADILAINLFEKRLEHSLLFNQIDEDANAILSYVENISGYTHQLFSALKN